MTKHRHVKHMFLGLVVLVLACSVPAQATRIGDEFLLTLTTDQVVGGSDAPTIVKDSRVEFFAQGESGVMLPPFGFLPERKDTFEIDLTGGMVTFQWELLGFVGGVNDFGVVGALPNIAGNAEILMKDLDWTNMPGTITGLTLLDNTFPDNIPFSSAFGPDSLPFMIGFPDPVIFDLDPDLPVGWSATNGMLSTYDLNHRPSPLLLLGTGLAGVLIWWLKQAQGS